jgi:hypothetical protein
VTLPLPRYVIAKQLASAEVGFYFNVPKLYQTLGARSTTSRLGRTTRLHVDPTVDELQHSTRFSMSGARPRTASRFLA